MKEPKAEKSVPALQVGPRSRVLLGLAALLFFGWVGYLVWLASHGIRPVVLSRAQLLVSTLDVIAEVQAAGDGQPQATVKIVEVHWPPGRAEALKDQSIQVVNLPAVSPSQGWQGPGLYILPLMPRGGDYQVVPTPVSPGYDPTRGPPLRIYPATADTRGQLETIRKPGA